MVGKHSDLERFGECCEHTKSVGSVVTHLRVGWWLVNIVTWRG